MSDKKKTTRLEGLIEDYLEYLTIERQVSMYTVRNYRQYLSKFVAWMKRNQPNRSAVRQSIRV